MKRGTTDYRWEEQRPQQPRQGSVWDSLLERADRAADVEGAWTSDETTDRLCRLLREAGRHFSRDGFFRFGANTASRLLGIDPTTATHAIDSIERRGWITMITEPDRERWLPATWRWTGP